MGPPRERRCGACRHFDGDPDRFEQALPGLTALGSGWGDTKGEQGICRLHQRMVDPDLSCEEHEPDPGG